MTNNLETIQHKTLSTFWDIVSQYKIEIPIIQRDYAQGRDSARVNPIREGFLLELIKSIKHAEARKLHLDFIYGKIQGKDRQVIFQRSKKAIESILIAVKEYACQYDITFDSSVKIPEKIEEATFSVFIPLDGQQRLTTLFLLHWYLARTLPDNKRKEALKLLRGFSYKTRTSTKEFCDFLASAELNTDRQLNQSISKTIKQAPNFYSIWLRDPSVQGMLITLDDIERRLKPETDETLVRCWENLTNNRKVTFDFLDLDEYEQTDELYVKMNARGKQLTDYEHFKSWLHEYTKRRSLLLKQNKWSYKIDTEWVDLFWKHKAGMVFEVDDIIYNFIKSVTLYEYLNSNDIDSIDKDLIEKIREVNREKNFISTSQFESSKFFTKKSLDFTFACLHKLSSTNLERLNDSLANVARHPFIGTQSNPGRLPFTYLSAGSGQSLPDRVFYYSFLLYITDENIDLSDDSSIEQLNKWMRICRNLIYNTYIQSPDNFIEAIKAIYEFSVHKVCVEDAILQNGFRIKYFDSQLREEIRKVQKFKLGERWKSRILEAENHTYFYGQIDFIFKLFDRQDDFETFNFYVTKLSEIFAAPEASDLLFHRLLLSKYDYLIQSGNKYSFCESHIGGLRARQDNWRKVFDDPDKLAAIKSILDQSSSIGISEASIESDNVSDWRTFFIKKVYVRNLKFLKERLIVFESDWDIKLLERSTFKGPHADLYSHSLYLDLQYEGFTVKYLSVNGRRSDDNKPYVEVRLQSENIRVYYEPNYNSEQSAFVIQSFPIEISAEITEDGGLEVSNGLLVYKMTKQQVATLYKNACNEIVALLKRIQELNFQDRPGTI